MFTYLRVCKNIYLLESAQLTVHIVREAMDRGSMGLCRVVGVNRPKILETVRPYYLDTENLQAILIYSTYLVIYSGV